MKHSPEHWKLDTICDADPERLVMCINACQYIPSESLNKIITAGLLQLCDRWDSFNKDCPEWVHEALHAKGVEV